MHISSSYAKILGEKLFRTWEIPRSGSKAEDGGKKKRKKERKSVITMAKLRMAQASTHGARKAHASRLGQNIYLLVLPKYWGETNFHTEEIPRSGSKAKGARKPPGPII